MKRELWAFTLKYLKRDIVTTAGFYEVNVFPLWANRQCAIVKCEYEENKQWAGIHCHGIVSIPTSQMRKELALPNYHLRLKKIFNLEGWEDYSNKEFDSNDYVPPEHDIKPPVYKIFKSPAILNPSEPVVSSDIIPLVKSLHCDEIIAYIRSCKSAEQIGRNDKI